MSAVRIFSLRSALVKYLWSGYSTDAIYLAVIGCFKSVSVLINELDLYLHCIYIA